MTGLDNVRLVLWRGAWHYAESSPGDQGVPFLTICGCEVPGNASVRLFKPQRDICGRCAHEPMETAEFDGLVREDTRWTMWEGWR